MVAAMALDIDYIGIDSNKSLKPGYDKLISLLKPYTKSKIRMIYKEAQKVNMSKLGKDGKPIYRDDGKVLKGPDYEPPPLMDLI